MRTDRFLDPPEFDGPARSRLTASSFFDRLDAHAGCHRHVPPERAGRAVVLRRARTRSTRTTLGQDQHQEINTFNVAPGYSQVIGSKTLFTANAFVRQDHLTYTPSADPFADQPASVSQDRTLTNFGVQGRRGLHASAPTT